MEAVIKSDSNERLKSLLSEALINICKTWAVDGRVDLTIEGLLAITFEKQVVLLNMKERVVSGIDEDRRQMDDAIQGLNLQASAGAVSTSDDIMHNLSYAFGSFLAREDCDKTAFEDVLTMDSQNGASADCCASDGPIKSKSGGEDLDESLLKSTLDYSSLSLPDVSNAMEKFSVVFDPSDENHSALFGNDVDFDDIINNKQSTKNRNDSLVMTCVGDGRRSRHRLLLNDDYIDLSFKNQNQLGELDRSGSSDNFGHDLLIVEDISEWTGQSNDDSIGDVGPLNLAGPQDLSLGLEKRKFICSACGTLYNDDVGHICESKSFHTAVVTSEPLNLKSQPLDLTTGPIYLAVDGSLTQPVLGGTTRVSYDLLTKRTLNCVERKTDTCRKCETCGKYLFSNSGYIKHKKQHAGKFRYVCEHCHKGFFDQTNLKAHIDSSHSKLKKHKCPNCFKSFFWKHHLKRHQESCKVAPIDGCAGEEVVAVVPSSDSVSSSLPMMSDLLLSIANGQREKSEVDPGQHPFLSTFQSAQQFLLQSSSDKFQVEAQQSTNFSLSFFRADSDKSRVASGTSSDFKTSAVSGSQLSSVVAAPKTSPVTYLSIPNSLIQFYCLPNMSLSASPVSATQTSSSETQMSQSRISSLSGSTVPSVLPSSAKYVTSSCDYVVPSSLFAFPSSRST